MGTRLQPGNSGKGASRWKLLSRERRASVRCWRGRGAELLAAAPVVLLPPWGSCCVCRTRCSHTRAAGHTASSSCSAFAGEALGTQNALLLHSCSFYDQRACIHALVCAYVSIHAYTAVRPRPCASACTHAYAYVHARTRLPSRMLCSSRPQLRSHLCGLLHAGDGLSVV